MGTHPSCPSTLLETGESLKIRPELLGAKVVSKFGEDLPFLFKVRFLASLRGIGADELGAGVGD
jgi:mannose-6-phosphate isomerase class I